MAEREYRRLARARARSRFAVALTARTSLWLGKDHLLQIDSNGYTETYKRFYFRDIQALVFSRTDNWLYQAVVLGGLACLFVLIAILGGGPVMAWVFGILAAILGLAAGLDLLSGPTAKCYVRTAVQTETLVSLNRVRRARKVFARLRPLISSVQGELRRNAESVEEAQASSASATNGLNTPSVQPGTASSNTPTESPA